MMEMADTAGPGIRSVGDELEARGLEVVARLRQDPFFRRLSAGEVDAEEYAAYLMQIHRWIRHAIRGLKGHADAMLARAARDPRQRPYATSADRHTEEEVGHDQLILDDLAVLWSCTPDEALGRIDREEASPSAHEWERTLDGLLARYPAAFSGIAVAIETVSGHIVDEMVVNLRARSGIPSIERALSFLEHHSSDVEGGHVGSAKMRVDALTSPAERTAAFYYGTASLAMFEAMHRYLAERFGARQRELVGAEA